MAMPVTRSFNPLLLGPTLAEVARERMGKRESSYKACIAMKSGDESPYKDRVITTQYGTLGPASTRGETTPIDFDAPFAIPEKTSTYTFYALGVKFSEAVWMDEKYGVMKDVAGSIGDSWELARDLLTARLWDNFFVTTYYTGQDSLALGSLSHLSYGGGAVRANILNPSASLSYTSLQNLRTLIRRQKDGRGNPTPQATNRLKLIVPPDLYQTAIALLDPASAYEPTSPNNAVNVLRKGTQWEIVENPYLTSTTQYFLADPNVWGIQMWDRQPMTPDSYIDKTDYGYVFNMRGRFVIHPAHWEGSYGSGN